MPSGCDKISLRVFRTMDDKEFINYFISRTDERLEKIEGKIDQLLSFKWQIIGGATFISVLITMSLQFFTK